MQNSTPTTTNPPTNPQANFHPRLLRQAQALDMATEAHRLLKGDGGVEITGVTQSETTFDGGRVITIQIINDAGAAALGRDIGTYITIELPALPAPNAPDLLLPASGAIAQAICALLPAYHNQQPILVAGLGNFRTTADAIGPKVIGHIQPTCHIFRPSLADEIRPVAAIAPGVVGSTGIETAALIKGVCDQIHPAAVIVVDALAARRLSGVMRSIQICDTGIRPGSGVQNHRAAINRAYLGVPVLAIGIPTVVQAASIATEAAEFACAALAAAPANLPDQIAAQMLAPFAPHLVVTPKDADELVPLAALIIAAGLTRALHPGATPAHFMNYMQNM